MEFKQLQSFVEVVRNRSFTKASQELFISQPTVSMHISQLESELGVRLIIRTTKSIEVTDLGRKLYEYAVNLLAMRDRMIANCSLQNRRILSLGASTIPSAYVLPRVLPEF
jgi:DNA-binding transcriptional LysR family regulator